MHSLKEDRRARKNPLKETAVAHSCPTISQERFIHEVNKRACMLYLQREQGDGSILSDWLQAENELYKKYHVVD